VNGDFSGLGKITWSTGPYDGDVYEGNLKHFDLFSFSLIEPIFDPNSVDNCSSS
jgi:hypothetical protein